MAAEKQYRNTSTADRGDFIATIIEEIKQAAERERAEIADDETLYSVRALLLTSGIRFN